MSSPRKFQAVRGVRDILPPDSSLWNWFERAAREVLEAYNFREIRLPIFEETELFARSIGADTDIVTKEMYSFPESSRPGGEPGVPRPDCSPSGPWVTLRPEATASVVRAYIEHGLHTQPGLVKLYYAGPMFRRERPQKGRYRQFYQIGAEVLGASDHPAIDAEMMEMLVALLGRCRVGGWTLLVNSIGDAACRPRFVALLREELRKVEDRLGPDSRRRIETNPLRVFDSKLPEEQAAIERLPKITAHLCADCQAHFAELRRQLDLRSVPYAVEPRLVRGLDYYTRTTFEITSTHLGAQNAIAGGGRYDSLSEMLGGPPAKGIGFALGEDRFVDVIVASGAFDPSLAGPALDAFIAWIGPGAYPAAVRLARRLRAERLSVELPAEEGKIRKALSLAERLGARYAVIVGEDEIREGAFTVKRLADGEQRKLSEGDVAAFVRGPGPAGNESDSQ